MPITPPRRPNPRDPSSYHPVDRRIHPVPGMRYRVLDAGWRRLWGHDLEYAEAKKLKTSIANKRLSSTVMIEAEDLPVPAQLLAAAEAAQKEHLATARWDGESPPVAAAPVARPILNVAGAQASALAVAGATAREAQERADAAQRRLQYKKEQEEAQRETEALAKKAAELAGGDDVGDGELADFLAGTGGMPTDEEIKKAKEAAAKATSPQT